MQGLGIALVSLLFYYPVTVGVWSLGLQEHPTRTHPQLGCRREWLLYLCRDKTGRSKEAGGGKDYALCLKMGCSCPPTPPQSHPHPGFQSGLRRLASLGGAFISIFRTGCSCHGTWLISGSSQTQEESSHLGRGVWLWVGKLQHAQNGLWCFLKRVRADFTWKLEFSQFFWPTHLDCLLCSFILF